MFQSILSSVICSILVVLLMACFLFSSFDGKNILNHVNEFNDYSAFMLKKGYYDDQYLSKLSLNKTITVTDNDIEEFYKLGYEGNIYKLYAKSNILGTAINSTQMDTGYHYSKEITDMYAVEGNGILDCDLAYLEKKFSVDGELKVLAGSLEEGFKDNGFVITDYIADCMMHTYTEYRTLSKEEAYKKIVERQTYNERFTVKAIIYTGYENRYPNIIELYKMRENPALISKFADELIKIKDTEEYYLFYNELQSSLVISYYIGKTNFYDAILEDHENTCYIITVNNSYMDILGDNPRNFYFSESALCAPDSYNLATDEIIVSPIAYNKAFGTSITDENSPEFKQQDITITIYDDMGKTGGNVVFKKTFKIVGVQKSSGNRWLFHKDVYKELVQINVKPYALIFDNTESITEIYDRDNDVLKMYGFMNESYKYVYDTVDVLKVFKDLFFIMVVLFAVGTVIMMSGTISKNVKRKTYDIGVLKGIGLKNKYVVEIFLRHLVLNIAIMITIISVSLFFVEDLLNGILTNNLMEKMPSILLEGMQVLKFDVFVILLVYLFVIALSIFTTFLLVSSLKKIKPIEIIKSKEL